MTVAVGVGGIFGIGMAESFKRAVLKFGLCVWRVAIW
jgi:hypothetical protein